MKKIFTISVACALCTTLNAETIKVLTIQPSEEIPEMQAPYISVMGLTLSANGDYVGGVLEQGLGLFVADARTGEVKYKLTPDGAELRNIDNNGLAIGVNDATGGVTYDFTTGAVTTICAPEEYKYFLGEALTNDGSTLFGSCVGTGFATYAYYTNDGKDWKSLPYPTDEQLGAYANRVRKESAVKQASGDGKVLLGNLGGFAIPTLWVMNDKGEYEVDFFPARFVKLTEEDRNDTTKPLYAISGMYGYLLSNNGRYVIMIGLDDDPNTGKGYGVPAIYDTVTKELKIFSEPQEIDDRGTGLYPTAIADDGTFIGTIGTPYHNSFGSFIWKAGEPQAELLITAFPEFGVLFGDSDYYGYNMPTGISADGSTIMGYTYYSDDYYDESSPAFYTTYIIDCGEDNAVDAIETEGSVDAIYSIDGRSLNTLSKGINIVRQANGKVKKILKR